MLKRIRNLKKQWLILGGAVLGLLVLLAAALIVILTTKPFHTGDLSGEAKGFSIVGRAAEPMQVRESGNFVVLQITDTHLVSAKGKDAKTIAALEEKLVELSPDLVVLSGDILDGYNSKIVADKRAALEALGDLFERHEQFWAYVPGNNDGEYLGSTQDVVAFLGKNYSHCLLSNEEELTGAVQFTLPLLDAEGQTVHALIFMDSLARDPETNYLTYNCMKKDQADWLRSQLTQLKEDAPQAKASVFFHMNTPAFTQAKNEGEPYAEDYAMPNFPDSWSIRGNEIVDRAISAAGNVGLVSIGHLHPSENSCAFLDSVYYHITRASGYQASRKPGAALITIRTYEGSPRRLYGFEQILFG